MLTSMLLFCYVSEMLTSAMERKMAQQDKQLNVRMAHETIDELKKAALDNRRSLTAQLNTIVEEWLKQRNQENAKA